MDWKWLTIRPSTIHMTLAEYSPTEQSTRTEVAFFTSVKAVREGEDKRELDDILSANRFHQTIQWL